MTNSKNRKDFVQIGFLKRIKWLQFVRHKFVICVKILTAQIEDVISIQTQNLLSLPENYYMNFYYYHFLTWPGLSWVAEDQNGRIVGYVLGKLYCAVYFPSIIGTKMMKQWDKSPQLPFVVNIAVWDWQINSCVSHKSK